MGLTPGTVSAVLNNSAASRSIPDRTRTRILQAARELKYRPNFMARSLRVQRPNTIGVILEEIGDGYGSMIVSGIEEYIREKNYFFLTVAHRHDQRLLQDYSQMLIARGVEGFITVDTSLQEPPLLLPPSPRWRPPRSRRSSPACELTVSTRANAIGPPRAIADACSTASCAWRVTAVKKVRAYPIQLRSGPPASGRSDRANWSMS